MLDEYLVFIDNRNIHIACNPLEYVIGYFSSSFDFFSQIKDFLFEN